jgi:phosphoglucosamine mutase
MEDAGGRYIEFAKNTFPRGLRLDGLKIVVDCANGAGYKVAPTVLWELGAEVIRVGVAPDGFNINRDCGSTVPDFLRGEVRRHDAHLGLALDGDADRVILSDERGQIIDGDQILALMARAWRASGQLRGDGIVATVMSNLGLERHLAAEGMTLHRTQVGDRYVMEKMRAGGFNVGGEQSGHMILSDYATTGDGLLAALRVLAIMQREGRPLSELAKVMTRTPQVLVNFAVGQKRALDGLPAVQARIAAAEQELGERGRVLVRYSGTEAKARVMIEGPDQARIQAMADDIAGELERACRA